jgi:hypothetical protein
MTSDTGHHIRYHAHGHLAWKEFAMAGLLSNTQFDLVDWQMVHNTLSMVLRMFPSMGMQASMEHFPDKLQTCALDDNKPTLPQLHAGRGNLQARSSLQSCRSGGGPFCNDGTSCPVDENKGNGSKPMRMHL